MPNYYDDMQLEAMYPDIYNMVIPHIDYIVQTWDDSIPVSDDRVDEMVDSIIARLTPESPDPYGDATLTMAQPMRRPYRPMPPRPMPPRPRPRPPHRPGRGVLDDFIRAILIRELLDRRRRYGY